MHAGSIDGSQCINDLEYFTQSSWADSDVTEDTIVRIDSGNPRVNSLGQPVPQQLCYNREAFRRWIQDYRMTYFPQNRVPFSDAQIAFLEGFQVGYHQVPPQQPVERPVIDIDRLQEWRAEMDAEIAAMREQRLDAEIDEELDELMAPAPVVIADLDDPMADLEGIENGIAALAIAPTQALAFVNANVPMFRRSF